MLPIVLIHGFPFDATMWDRQVRFLGEQGHTVLTPTLPGFGGTPALPKEKTSIEAFAAHVHEVIHTQASGRAIVGGFSMGGYVLLSLLRDYPESVAAAMLIDTRADPDKPEVKANRLASIEEIQKNGTAGVFDAMLPKVLSKRPTPAIKDQARSMMEKQSAEGAAHALWAMSRRRDQMDLLPEVKIPVLVVVGADDGITPPSVALAMQSHMPHAMVVQIVGAGHLSPVEQPDAVSRSIETFLATVK